MNIYCSDAVLESVARQIIISYDSALLADPAPIPVETIMEKVYGLTIEFQFIRNNGRVLGETVFEDAMIPIYKREGCKGGYTLVPVKANTVLIDASLIRNRSDGRFRYTCAHELAHFVWHKGFFTQLGETAAMTKATRTTEIGNALERQANRMASYLLMPKGTVKMAFYRNRAARDVAVVLGEIFGVSKEAMGYRLKEMRLLD